MRRQGTRSTTDLRIEPALVEALGAEPDGWVRRQVLEALREQGREAVLSAIETFTARDLRRGHRGKERRDLARLASYAVGRIRQRMPGGPR